MLKDISYKIKLKREYKVITSRLYLILIIFEADIKVDSTNSDSTNMSHKYFVQNDVILATFFASSFVPVRDMLTIDDTDR